MSRARPQRPRGAPGGCQRAGFTLVELLLALGLLSVLLLALVRLVDTSLTIWDRSESSRDLMEMGNAVARLVHADVTSLETGPRGDLLADWQRFDLDGDGTRGALWPRLRLVRLATPAEWRRVVRAERAARGTVPARPGTEGDADGEAAEDDAGASPEGQGDPALSDPRRHGRIEVAYALLPSSTSEVGPERDERSLGVLWRGERRLGGPGLSFFDEEFFDAAGRPAPGTLEPVTGGVLWFELLFASQTTLLGSGWTLGPELADAAASWDAWGRARPDPGASEYNEPAAGMPAAKELPLLPRRVRLAIEIERPRDLDRRTRLSASLAPDLAEISVRDPERLPAEGTMIRIDEEWMELRKRLGDVVQVKRGRRGTQGTAHEAGALVHHGTRLEREFIVPVVGEDWDL